MAIWTVQVVDAPHVAGASVRGVLTTANAQSLTLDKDDVSSFQWTMRVTDAYGTMTDEARMIAPRATDVIVYRDTHALFRGRVRAHSMAYSADGQRTATLTANSYKYLLGRRIIADEDGVWPNAGQNSGAKHRNYVIGADLGSIIWDLITMCARKTNETLGINASTDGLSTTSPAAMTSIAATVPTTGGSGAGTALTGGSGNTGVNRNVAGAGSVIQFNTGDSVLDAINNIAQGDTSTAGAIGVEWDVYPDDNGTLRLHLWSLGAGGRGANVGYTLDWPGLVASGTTDDDIENFANSVLTLGGDTIVPVTKGAADATYGLYEKVQSVTVPTQGTTATQQTAFMNSQSAYWYAQWHAIRPAYTLTLRPGAWSFGDCWLGDVVTIKVPSFEGPTVDTQRVQSMVFTPGDDGGELITIGLGAVPMFSAKGLAMRQNRALQRIVALEKFTFSPGWQGNP
jgi:hypothetical protein